MRKVSMQCKPAIEVRPTYARRSPQSHRIKAESLVSRALWTGPCINAPTSIDSAACFSNKVTVVLLQLLHGLHVNNRENDCSGNTGGHTLEQQTKQITSFWHMQGTGHPQCWTRYGSIGMSQSTCRILQIDLTLLLVTLHCGFLSAKYSEESRRG